MVDHFISERPLPEQSALDHSGEVALLRSCNQARQAFFETNRQPPEQLLGVATDLRKFVCIGG